MQWLMKRQTSVMKWKRHDPSKMFLLSSGPSKHYGQALCYVLNTELPKHLTNRYITEPNYAINILLVKLGLVCPSKCIGLHALKSNTCYSLALTILLCLSYSVMNRSAWKLNNKLRCKRENKQSILHLFDHLGVLCSVQKK